MFQRRIASLSLVVLGGLSVAEAATPKPKATYTNADLATLPTAENERLPSAEPPPGTTPLPPVPKSDNAALERLPKPENDRLPSLEPPSNVTPLPPLPATSGSAAAESPSSPAPRVDPQAIEWLEGRMESLKLESAIAAARRRLDEASAKLGQLKGSLRPDGSAFPTDTVAADEMYSRDVTDHDNRYDAALQRAYDEQAAARAELEALLRQRDLAYSSR